MSKELVQRWIESRGLYTYVFPGEDNGIFIQVQEPHNLSDISPASIYGPTMATEQLAWEGLWDRLCNWGLAEQ